LAIKRERVILTVCDKALFVFSEKNNKDKGKKIEGNYSDRFLGPVRK
jgi:hypothetical protein